MKEKSSSKKVIISVLVILLSLFAGGGIGYNMNVNNAVVEDLKAKNDEYITLTEKLDSVKGELDTNSDVLKEMEEYKAKNIEISNQQKKLDELTTLLAEKQAEYDTLSANVEKVKGEPKVLPAGSYLVGQHVPAGRYKITGESNFFLRTSGGYSVVNIILGGRIGIPEYITDMEAGQTIETRGGCTLTPVE